MDTAPDLCPYEGRRSTKELWVKLVVVNFTVIAAFCHVLDLRREPIVRWKLVYYVIVPYLLIVYHALALLTITAGFIYCLIRPSSELRDSLERAPRWIFGVVSKEGEGSGTYELLPSTEVRRPVTGVPEDEAKWKKIGRCLLASTFVLQCIGTIVLYSRRKARNAVTSFDQRVFELGCSGLITGCYWLALTLDMPPFSEPAPDPHDNARTTLDRIMIYLRDCQTPPFFRTEEDGKATNSFFISGALGLLVLLATNKIRLVEYISLAIRERRLPQEREYTLETVLVALSFSILLLGLALAWRSFLDECKTWRRQARPLHMRSFVAEDCIWVLYPVFSIISVLIGAGCVTIFIMVPVGCQSLVEQSANLNTWPTNTPCPLLWSDPAASWVWALA